MDSRAEGPCGLLDIKGTGVAPEKTPRLKHVQTGIVLLSEALHDLVMQWMIDEIFNHEGVGFHTVPTYAIIDAGFDCHSELGRPHEPAAITVRRAHRRRKEDRGWRMPGIGHDRWDFPVLHSYEYAMMVELEMLLRKYGITSCSAIPLVIDNRGAELIVEYNDECLSCNWPKDAQNEVRNAIGIGKERQSIRSIATQFARVDESFADTVQLLDFESYKVETQFAEPWMSRARDQVLTIGKIVWPSDAEYLQPDPKLQFYPAEVWRDQLLRNRLDKSVASLRNGKMSRDDLCRELESLMHKTTV